MRLLDFYQGKKILITGHTGFKGTWLSKILIDAGAFVSGYALQPSDNPCFFDLANITNGMYSVLGDIRDIDRISTLIEKFEPEIVIHMAAQAIVRDGYRDPVYTYGTNVMGTVNILDAIRKTDCVRSFLNVTTDKVYENKEIDNQQTEKPKAIEIPEELEKAFGTQTGLKDAFSKLSPGKQKEYCEYIASAKQEATRISRLEKCIPLILNGSGLNDKYRKNC